MIEFHDVCKSYVIDGQVKPILSGVSLRLGPAQRLGILGKNGAGKSTLIRLAGGVEKPSSGHIKRTGTCSWPLGFGGAFQTSLSGSDNIRFIARIYNLPFGVLRAGVEEFSELKDELNDPVRTYSSGMRARFAFGLSLCIDFDCLLIDEVIAVGDERFRKKCHEQITKRLDRSMIFVSHDLNLIQQYCNQFAALKDGNLVLGPTLQAAVDLLNN